ncbi:hypothetical protein PR002_g5293 [Phytophthora rubi]|uniref:Uncharacterized protein n=1 Tax=Phytophthora rubi TaxID=129364 RepID=A0A6A3N2Z2_9STRA|nr:hypothetical protein PR002_g5293 [Phytophthora rubi]
MAGAARKMSEIVDWAGDRLSLNTHFAQAASSCWAMVGRSAAFSMSWRFWWIRIQEPMTLCGCSAAPIQL